MSKRARLLQVCRLLNGRKARYLVIGAWACNFHGLVRATKDVDVLIPKNDIENARLILEALRGLLWGMAGELDADEVARKPVTIIGDSPPVDLLTVAGKVQYEEARKTALEAEVDGVKIPYVDFETLLKTKATDRLQDRADVERLKRIKGSQPRGVGRGVRISPLDSG